MATSANPAKFLSSKHSRTYRLEMEGRTLMLLVGLLALTGLVVFYLGMLSGMGLRDANTAAPVAGLVPATPSAASGPNAQGAAQPTGEEALKPESLSFNQSLTGDKAALEGLRITDSGVTQRTEALLTRAERELVLEEVPVPKQPLAAGPAAPQVVKPSAAAPAAPQVARPSAAAPAASRANAATPAPARQPQAPTAPQAAAPTANGDGAYTVQVFSSQHADNAQELVSNLRRQGFNAYMNQFQAANSKTWYRVRVGRGATKAEAETLKERLMREANIKSPAVLRQ
ncbi:MAG: SPOR domain-containing protein [Candidatus Lambdaproteobacteria bacterium]|nr:SPOR domain-containing protein [Candidatus Lambdaproteobacteria bacterium]